MSVNKRSEENDLAPSRGSIGSRTVGDFPVDESREKDVQGEVANEESAIPEDRIAEQRERDAEKAASDNWHEDPRNPRLWPGHRKWTAAVIVSLYTFVSYVSFVCSKLSATSELPSFVALLRHRELSIIRCSIFTCSRAGQYDGTWLARNCPGLSNH